MSDEYLPQESRSLTKKSIPGLAKGCAFHRQEDARLFAPESHLSSSQEDSPSDYVVKWIAVCKTWVDLVWPY
ncbi:unnamed protein product [Cuscuta campestris]|uniref:Uncharacterized protein n=2 Tax=Cuscuta sect. Cleistogrammica TaxID=1824901 RepID=A0A484M1X3_9ASTE|nr:hypothetical protein DM860_006184 [Cuscuta australis]VFQ82781.1 unnamed protein product [Cuscuta campestris]